MNTTTSQIADVCPNNFQDERKHEWGWCSVTSFSGGRSGIYARCCNCEAQDWTAFERLIREMPPPAFRTGDTVMYRDERWRWDITGNIRLDLVKVTEHEAIVLDSFVNPVFQPFAEPLEWRYSILCRDGDSLLERTPTVESLTPFNHGGTISQWKAKQPRPGPRKLQDSDLALTEPRLRSIGVQFEEHQHTYRCANCDVMQPEGTPIAYVRDEFSTKDKWRVLVEAWHRSPYNGHGSGWCPSCAHKLLPKWSKAYLKFIATGRFPMKVYMSPVCLTCGKDVSTSSYYYRNVGEDKWEVYCRECRYSTHSHDMYEGGFGQMLGSSSRYIGTLEPGQSVTL